MELAGEPRTKANINRMRTALANLARKGKIQKDGQVLYWFE